MAAHAEILTILDQLEQLVQSQPVVAAEWRDAWQTFSDLPPEPASYARYREWFLLERDSVGLGSAPIVAWSPADVAPDSPWGRLLDSFLGIFRLNGITDDGSVELTELWTGRDILVEGIPAERLASPQSLVVGRFVLASVTHYLPLPGVRILDVPGLPDALEADLLRIRREQPRQRLSQVQLEHLLRPFHAASHEAPELDAELDALIADYPEWTRARLAREIENEGVSGTIDKLAFETSIDLEALRRILPEWSTQPARPVAPPAAGTPLDPGAAVARFESGRDQGRPLESLFEELEQAFGLEPGSTVEGDPADETATLGEGRPPGLTEWIEAFRWERKALGETPTAAEDQALAQLTSFLGGLLGERLEMRELNGLPLLAFLSQESDPAAAIAQWGALQPFLRWACREQEAPLEGLLDEDAERRAHLTAVLALNSEWTADGRQGMSLATVRQLEPLAVNAYDNDRARVVGAPPNATSLLRIGDVLLGRWTDGAFEPSTIVPRELVGVPESDSGN